MQRWQQCLQPPCPSADRYILHIQDSTAGLLMGALWSFSVSPIHIVPQQFSDRLCHAIRQGRQSSGRQRQFFAL